MRKLIHSEPLSYKQKSELFGLLAQYGPDAAWKYYREITKKQEEATCRR